MNGRWRPVIGGALAIVATCAASQEQTTAVPGAGATSQSLKSIIATRLPDQSLRALTQKIESPKLLEVLEEETRPLEAPGGITDRRREEIESRVRDRLFVASLASGAVSSEALAVVAPGASRDTLKRAAVSDPDLSPIVPSLRRGFNEELVITAKLSEKFTLDPDTPAPPGTSTSDLKKRLPLDDDYDQDSGRFRRLIRREGFASVVLIGRVTDQGPVNHCSATAIGGNWIITAAHCFQEADGSSIEKGKLSVYLPFAGGVSDVNAPNSREGVNRKMLPVAIEKIVLFDRSFNRRSAPPDNGNDIALIELAAIPRAAGLTPVRLVLNRAAPPVTLAGYGLTNAKDPGQYGSTLEIARRRSAVIVRSENIELDAMDTTERTGRACFGDSGGPVFAGEPNGTEPANSHVLIGVVSGAEADGESVFACNAARQFAVRTDRAAVAKWICETTNKKVCYA